MSDFYFSPETLGFFHLLEDEEQEQVTQLKIENCLNQLTKRQRNVVELRYGLNDNPPQTLREVAEQVGVSHTTVRLDIKTALTKLTELK